ncbi:MAG: YhbY family RNA-binding protein [Acetanaerobacterium sp.]
MLTSKERASLRALANPIDTILQIGKNEISDALVTQVDGALTARELIKLRVLETAPYTPREAADMLALRVRAEVVQVIGTRFVLYRKNLKKPVITF